MENIALKTEYKELTGRDFTPSDAAKEIDAFIDKLKSLNSLSNFDKDTVQEVMTCVKRNLYGIQISVNIKKLDKSVEILKKTPSTEIIAEELGDLCNFFVKLIQNSIDDIKSSKDNNTWKKSVNRASWKK